MSLFPKYSLGEEICLNESDQLALTAYKKDCELSQANYSSILSGYNECMNEEFCKSNSGVLWGSVFLALIIGGLVGAKGK